MTGRRGTRRPGFRTRAGAVAAATALTLVACGDHEPTAATGNGPDGSSSPATAVVDVEGVTEPLDVEVARTAAEQAHGLMGRTELPPGTGMLFVWDDARERSFWMRDTLIPLDIAWVADGRVTGVTSMQPCRTPEPDDCDRYLSPGAVDAAIEAPPGTFDDVVEGARVDVRDQ